MKTLYVPDIYLVLCIMEIMVVPEGNGFTHEAFNSLFGKQDEDNRGRMYKYKIYVKNKILLF